MAQIEWDNAPAQAPTRPAIEWDAPPTTGQQISGALGRGREYVGKILKQVDTLGGRLPGTPAGSFVSPESVNPVPRNLTEGLMTTGLGLAGGVYPRGQAIGSTPVQQLLSRVTLGTLGGAAGMSAEGRSPVSWEGVKEVALPIAASELVSAVVPAVARKFTGAKGLENELESQGLKKTLAGIDPEVGRTIEAQQVEPTLRGGKTFAKMRQAVTSGAVQDVASAGMDRQMGTIDALSGSPKLKTPNLEQAYAAMPSLAKDKLVLRLGPVDPTAGFTLPQAQAIRGWVNSKAFAMSPQGQGLGPVPQQLLAGDITHEIESALSPAALPLWKQMNLRYGGTMAIAEPLGEQGIVQGLPNRLFLNRNYLSQRLDQERQDLTRRMGQPAYDALVQDVLSGAQPGTRDILVPGAGTSGEAFRQIGRGMTGSLGAVRAPILTLLPGAGSQKTGRSPFVPPPQLKALLDLLFQRKAQDLQGQP